MDYNYEIIHGHEGLPVKTTIHAIDSFQMHWHNEMEILLVLDGSVSIRIGEDTYYLNENDIILVNNNELHSTRRTRENNSLLAVQINPEFYNNMFPDFSKFKFDCKSFKPDAEEKTFDAIRYYIAKIVWELNKKDLGYQLRIASNLNLLGEYLLNNFDYYLVDEDDEELRDTDLARLQRIIEYVNENFSKKITLKEIAEREHLNYYYLSHFIKNKIGMSFQEYLNTVRLDKAVRTLISTDMSIIDVSNSSGFSNVNSFNSIFRENYNCTPTEFRKSENSIVGGNNIKRSKTYLDVNRDAALEKLFTYLELEKESETRLNPIKEDVESVQVNIQGPGRPLKHYWKNLATFGRAHEGLRANGQLEQKHASYKESTRIN